jgi:hypothetical protein
LTFLEARLPQRIFPTHWSASRVAWQGQPLANNGSWLVGPWRLCVRRGRSNRKICCITSTACHFRSSSLETLQPLHCCGCPSDTCAQLDRQVGFLLDVAGAVGCRSCFTLFVDRSRFAVVLHCVTLRYVALHCFALNCAALCCTVTRGLDNLLNKHS